MVKIENITKNKRGWIRIVEVFVSIVLLTSVLLVVSTKNSSKDIELQEQISNKEVAILQDIELNNQMRSEILGVAQENLPLEWEEFGSSLQDITARINTLVPKDLECQAKLCLLSDICMTNWSPKGDVYAKSVVISADLNNYSPRQLKLFCTLKSD